MGNWGRAAATDRAVILLAMVFLGGCVSQPPASPAQSVCRPDLEHVPDPSAKRRPSSDRPLLFPIRLTDDGEYVSRCELTDALQELRAPGAYLAVIYIHGWKHNAHLDDPDRLRFQALLNRLGDEQALLAARPRRPRPLRVVGLFIAWNGESVAVPVVENLSFWGRKKASDLIAHSATTTKIISAIDAVQQRRRALDPHIGDVTVYVGHSFGARMLYSAVSQVLIHNVESEFPDTLGGQVGVNLNQPLPPDARYGAIAGFGDLVVLLNPAFEASFYKSFQTLVRPGGSADAAIPRERFAPTQEPLMLTLSAKNDMATRIAFPLGQTIAFDASRIRRTTLGNYPPALTHSLDETAAGSTKAPGTYWFDDFCSQSVCLRRDPQLPTTGDPFIVAQAPPSIIDGHSGIWGAKLQDFLVAFIGEVIRRRDAVRQ
jgi:hypothetical protein